MKHIIFVLFSMVICLIPLKAEEKDFSKVKIAVIDHWQCGKQICGVSIDEEGKVYLFIADNKGLSALYHKGKLVYARDTV